MKTIPYGRYEIQVSDIDYEDARKLKWRVIRGHYGILSVVRSVERWPGDRDKKRNQFLGHWVAQRMGALPGPVSFIDGNSLNCQRSNLKPGSKGGMRPGTTVPKPTRCPPGSELHTHRIGTAKPPNQYEICAGVKHWDGKCHEGIYVGTARRTGDGGWVITLRSGSIAHSGKKFSEVLSRAVADSEQQAAGQPGAAVVQANQVAGTEVGLPSLGPATALPDAARSGS